MKNFIAGNQLAWEEAYDKAPKDYKDISKTIQSEPYAYLHPRIKELADRLCIQGKTIAQFCCNNGREVLSLAYNYHAKEAYGFELARNMAQDAELSRIALGIQGAVVQTDVEAIGGAFDGKFDYIFMFIGAICWFDERKTLFHQISRCLKPTGKFVLMDAHPFTNLLLANGEEGYDPNQKNKIGYSYWKKVPFTSEGGMSYMVKEDYVGKLFMSYSFRFDELITDLIENGLYITLLEEYPEDVIETFADLSNTGIPMSFALVASKNPTKEHL